MSAVKWVKILALLLCPVMVACGQPTGKVTSVYDYTSCRAEGGSIDNMTPPSCTIKGRKYTARVTRA